MRVESDAEQLVEEFTPGDSFQFIVRAEAGNLGLEYIAPYTGFQIEVDAVLDQNIEDERVQNAIDRCGVAHAAETQASLFLHICTVALGVSII